MTYLIDPANITNFNLSKDELELQILFWVCAAGKNGTKSAQYLNNLLFEWSDKTNLISPFEIVKQIPLLPYEMFRKGIGCYNIKSKTFLSLSNSNLDLKICSVEDLEEIKGIGPKTARGFILHTRPSQRLACLDTHLLKFMAERGYSVPKSTPTGNKYKQIEQNFLSVADSLNKSPSELDLEIWNSYKK